jgi:photosynthetic reaction center H subunit
MASEDMDRVVPLGQMDDFTVAKGDPDVRGWEVLASDGRKIGEVDELLVDARAMKVRYLDVDLEDAVAGSAADRHVLIPVGYARLDRERDCVRVDALASEDLAALPRYDQGPLRRDFEASVRDRFHGGGGSVGEAAVSRDAPRRGDAAAESGAGHPDDDFYAGSAFDDQRFYGGAADRGDAGGAARGIDPDRLDDGWSTRRVGQVGDL